MVGGIAQSLVNTIGDGKIPDWACFSWLLKLMKLLSPRLSPLLLLKPRHKNK